MARRLRAYGERRASRERPRKPRVKERVAGADAPEEGGTAKAISRSEGEEGVTRVVGTAVQPLDDDAGDAHQRATYGDTCEEGR